MQSHDETKYQPRTGQQVTVCLTKAALLNEYEDALATFSDAVTSLRASMGILSREEYGSAYQRTEELREITRKKQEALTNHTLAHHC